MMKWYVLQVHSGFEKSVVNNILSKVEESNLSHLLGDIKFPGSDVEVDSISKSKQKQSARKLGVSGYILIQASLTSQLLSVITAVPKVSKFLGVMGADNLPASTPDDEVDSFLTRTGEEARSTAVSANMFSVGEEVEVIDGAFKEFKGIIEEIPDGGRIKVSISVFGRPTPTEFDPNNLRKIK